MTNLFLAGVLLWSIAVAAVLAVLPAAFSDRLPDPIASHWSFDGTPDDSMSLPALVAFSLVMWVVLAGCALLLAARGRKLRSYRASAAAVLAASTVFVLGVELSTLLANLDVPTWQQARSVSWQAVVIIAVAAVAGLLGWWAANRGPNQEEGEPLPAGKALRLPSGQRAVWISSVSSRALQVVGIAALLVAVGLLVTGQPPAAGVVTALSALVVLALCSARVQVDERGVRVVFGPQRWPGRRIPLERIEHARAEHRNALEAGGWGYRVLPAFTAIMLRSGECLVLRLDSGREFVISTDHAERGAELVNALVAERVAQRGGER